MGRAEALIALRQALSVDPELELLEEPGELQRHSRDAFEYSPVLIRSAGAPARSTPSHSS